jgi:hypothetical protein
MCDLNILGTRMEASVHLFSELAYDTYEAQLLSPQRHFLKSGQKQEKQEMRKLTTNTIRIPGGHRQKRLRVGPLARGLRTPVPDKDSPAIMDATAPTAGKGGSTYKTPSKSVIPVTISVDTHSLQVIIYQCETKLWR